MKKIIIQFIIVSLSTLTIIFTFSSCHKEPQPDQHYNLDVSLRGGKSFGFIKFTQDPDPAKIIILYTWVRGLKPNHEYLLQRAVDAANMVDNNCSSTSWLTLGKGLIPQSILTDDKGNGEEELWRDVTAIPSGAKFDIHFQIIDAATMGVVLTSDCYWYQVR
ncbi:MAG TPA: hypothetical protein VIQ23_01735 [Hanamia sp.]